MKKFLGSRVCGLLMLTLFFCSNLNAQITITADEFPTAVGTLILTKNNCADSILVDVGSAGENQQWLLNQEFPDELFRQLIVAPTETAYSVFFPESDVVTRYVGNLGNFMDSYYFENTVGTFYLYQKKTADQFLLQGIGFDSTTVHFGDISITYSGYFDVQPSHALFQFPLEYNKSWQSVSNFSMQVDTLLDDVRVSLLADVRDSVYNIVDGWGHLVLPTTTYECLRLKSEIVLNEKIFLNGAQVRSKTNRVVNYYWLNDEKGIVAKVSSFLNPENDAITLAKRIYRLHMFNPQINIAVADTVAAPDDVLDVPIITSDLTDLDIQKMSMCIHCDTSMVKPIGILKQNCLIEEWHEPKFAFVDSSFQIELSGDEPLKNGGVLCYLRLKVLPLAVSDTTTLCVDQIKVSQAGPRVNGQSGRLIITAVPSAVSAASEFGLLSFNLLPNYPNPFNHSTTVSFDLLKPAHVGIYIYNSMGQLVSVLADQKFEIGCHALKWAGVDGANRFLPSGIYFCRVEAFDSKDRHRYTALTRKMMLLR